MGPLISDPPRLVMTPTNAPHHGPRTIAATAVPIMSKKVGSFRAPLIVPPTILSAAATGTRVMTYVRGMRSPAAKAPPAKLVL